MIENCCQGQLFGSTAQQGGNLENPDSQNLGACLSGIRVVPAFLLNKSIRDKLKALTSERIGDL